MLEVERGEDRGVRTFFLEFDRTRRVDKNYEKFRRYDAFLNWWWRFTAWADLEEAPAVLFICQDEERCRQFVTAAGNELTPLMDAITRLASCACPATERRLTEPDA